MYLAVTNWMGIASLGPIQRMLARGR